MRMFERRCVQVLANGHAGQSFRLACLPGRNPGGCPPQLLRDRPADGLHGSVILMWVFGSWAGSCGCSRGVAFRFWRTVTRVSLSDWLAFQAGIRGFKNPRLLRDRPADGWHRSVILMRVFGSWAGSCGCLRGVAFRFWRMVTRVSLSDWLAFQAGIWGGENPQLLRDRPADGLHGWRKSAREWGMGYLLCMGSNSVDGGKGYEGLMAEGLPLVAKGPPLGRGGMGGENICGGSACRVARV